MYIYNIQWVWSNKEDSDTKIGVFRTEEVNNMEKMMQPICSESSAGECEYIFTAEGEYFFSSGYVEKDSKVSFGVTVNVDAPPQSILSELKVKVKGRKRFILFD